MDNLIRIEELQKDSILEQMIHGTRKCSMIWKRVSPNQFESTFFSWIVHLEKFDRSFGTESKLRVFNGGALRFVLNNESVSSLYDIVDGKKQTNLQDTLFVQEIIQDTKKCSLLWERVTSNHFISSYVQFGQEVDLRLEKIQRASSTEYKLESFDNENLVSSISIESVSDLYDVINKTSDYSQELTKKIMISQLIQGTRCCSLIWKNIAPNYYQATFIYGNLEFVVCLEKFLRNNKDIYYLQMLLDDRLYFDFDDELVLDLYDAVSNRDYSVTTELSNTIFIQEMIRETKCCSLRWTRLSSDQFEATVDKNGQSFSVHLDKGSLQLFDGECYKSSLNGDLVEQLHYVVNSLGKTNFYIDIQKDLTDFNSIEVFDFVSEASLTFGGEAISVKLLSGEISGGVYLGGEAQVEFYASEVSEGGSEMGAEADVE